MRVWILVFLFATSSATAAPSIGSVSSENGVAHGNDITITGSGFGPGARILFYDDFEGDSAKVDNALVEGTTPKIGDEWRDRTHFPNYCHGQRGYDTRPRYDSNPSYRRTERSTVSVKHRLMYDEELHELTGWNQCDWSLIEAYWAGGTYPDGPNAEKKVYVSWWYYYINNPDNNPGYVVNANFKLWGFDEYDYREAWQNYMGSGGGGGLRWGWECNGCEFDYEPSNWPPRPPMDDLDIINLDRRWTRHEAISELNTATNANNGWAYYGIYNTAQKPGRDYIKIDDRRNIDFKNVEQHVGWRSFFLPYWASLHRSSPDCPSYVANGTPCIGDYELHTDMFYAATTPARVEVCDSASWSGRKHCELQPLLGSNSWAPGEITVQLNQGSFSSLCGRYIYVVDEDMQANAAGYEIESCDGTPIEPTGSRPEAPVM